MVREKQQGRIGDGISVFTVFWGMLTAGDGTFVIDIALSAVVQVHAGIVDQQMPSLAILEDLNIFMVNLPQQSIEITNGARR